jgi:hypothetical protein
MSRGAVSAAPEPQYRPGPFPPFAPLPFTTTCDAPLDVSSSSEHGTPLVKVCDDDPRMMVRAPVPPDCAKARCAANACPDVTVNGVAVPIAVPAEFRNEMLPVQDAAVQAIQAHSSTERVRCGVRLVDGFNGAGGGRNQSPPLLDVFADVRMQ